MKTTNLVLLSFLVSFAAVFQSVVPSIDAASTYGGHPAADADEDEALVATLNQMSNDEIEVGDDIITVLRKGGGGGVVGGGGEIGRRRGSRVSLRGFALRRLHVQNLFLL